VVHGLLGVGFDAEGAYGSPYAANPLSGPGFWPESVSVRGPGDGTNGFAYLSGRALAATSGLPQTARLEGVDESNGGRPVRISISGGQLTVSMDFGAGLVTVLGPIRSPDLPASGLVKVGFSATGSDIREIRAVQISVPPSVDAGPAPSSTTTSRPQSPTTLGPVSSAAPAGSTSVPAGSTSVPAGSTSVPGGSTNLPAGSTSLPAATVLPAQPPSAALPSRHVTEGSLVVPTSTTTALGPRRLRNAVVSTLINVAVTAQPIAPGATGPMTVTLSNVSGSALASSVTLNIRLPDGASIPSSAPLPGGCSSVYGSLVNCTIPQSQMSAGARVDLTIQATVDPSTPLGSTLNGGAVTPFLNGDSASGQPVGFTMTAAGGTTATTAASTTVAGGATSVPTASTAAPPSPTGLTTLPFTGAQVGGLTVRGLILVAVGAALVLASLARRRSERAVTSGGLVGSGLVGSGLVGSGLVGSGLVGSGTVGLSATEAMPDRAASQPVAPDHRNGADPVGSSGRSALFGAGAVLVGVASVARRVFRGRSGRG